MPSPAVRSTRLLPDGTPLHNRLLAVLPAADYARIQKHLHMNTGVTGRTLQAHGMPVTDVYFPNGGVFSVTSEMRNGTLVEVATVGIEGMLGIGVFLGDRSGAGRTFQQVPDGPFPSMSVDRFIKEGGTAGPFRDVVALYAQANLLQIMQCTACNALHGVKQRCCRWLLQTQDRVGSREFFLKQEFLAIMLGVQRPTVTLVMGALQDEGLITTRVRTNSGAEEEEARTGRVRVLRGHPGALQAARVVTSTIVAAAPAVHGFPSDSASSITRSLRSRRVSDSPPGRHRTGQERRCRRHRGGPVGMTGVPSATLIATRLTVTNLCGDGYMTNRREEDENDPDAAQRNRRRSEDAPAWRPDDEVPANRREHPQRGDHNDEQEHRERQGS